MYKSKNISLYLASGLVALLAACGQSEVKPIPEEPTVEAQVLPLNLVVGNTADSSDANPGDGLCISVAGGCTLRAAIEETNAWPGKDNINVPAGTYEIWGVGVGAGLTITDSVVIKGSMEGQSIIDGNKSYRILVENGGYTRRPQVVAEFHHLIIQNGRSSTAGGAILNMAAKVLINKSTLRDNHTYTLGGAVANSLGGIMEIRYSTIRNNISMSFSEPWTKDSRGGGISNGKGGHLTLYKSVVHSNQANRVGGIHNQGTMNIANSTVSHNTSFMETGGMFNSGEANLNNVTLAYNQGTLEGIIEDDSTGNAGGIHNVGLLRMANSIVSNNTNHKGTTKDCLGDLTSMGYNLIKDDTDCSIMGDLTGNLIGQSPMLMALSDNGGLTRTHALGNNSPARNAGNPAAPTGVGARCQPDDQRNMNRGGGPAKRCDMGAYEAQGAPGGVVSP